ncbi:hypothetical protein D9619_013297 [Psilocybe cf. subviscida]|uniref:Uncharacterized protein n=1 Tax=Psilocybe cf. subviscida TaxID=2480587 RepID=A0A8H5BRX2_9AGAR|nr:hypothetical protein D9619_013297 [Psilocybe cf. subviscida]
MAAVTNSNSPQLNNAMQVLGILSEVGSALPYVAPAFILLKVIIDLEKRAADVDAKCSDLIERITFMVSHLPALLKVEITTPTRQVIDRMNESIKDAAALIAAYRKQGRVARRLSLTNREKFTVCAETINNCSRDLLMSLQIRQTIQLDILTREVPIDEDDAAAKVFVDAHGGSIDAIVHDRELVKEFAEQRHLVMDDSVMEQLKANIADAVQQNHVRLEGVLRDNVGGAIKDGLKSLAAEMLLAEAEQKFHCVQCDKEFTDYTSGPKACAFHRAEYDPGSKSYPCCSIEHPCEFGPHRAKHHCDYPYGAFFSRSRGVLNYPETHEKWTSVEDTNLETSGTQTASVSELYRWASRGGRVTEKTLLITVGRVRYDCSYYFNTFTTKQLEEITKSVRLSRRVLIFRTSDSEDEYAQAEWVLSLSGEITGVRITAKTATSPNPYVRVCPIDLATCTKSGDITTVSEGGIRSYTPSESYVLPQNIRIGPELSSEPTRLVRKNFKTRTTPALKVILKTISEPPLAANPAWYDDTSDYFRGTVSAFNNNPSGSLNTVTISGIRAEFRMVGQQNYTPVKDCKFTDGSESLLPYSIDPRKSWQINFEVCVPRLKEDAELHVSWPRRAFMARYQPVRVKLILEDIEDEECSLVLEHVFRPYPYERAKENAIGFFFFDNPIVLKRYAIQVEPVSGSRGVVKIGSVVVNETSLNMAVYKALKSGQTEIDLKLDIESALDEWESAVYALVDVSCRRVYAFKIIMQERKKVPVKRFGCQGYVLCPDYGKSVDDVRTISYATEMAKLPSMEPYSQPDYPQDDAFDDFKPPVPLNTVPSPSMKGPPLSDGINGYCGTVSPELNAAFIATSLVRIADALEKLVEMGRISQDKM